jgi:hypothetical protein
LVYCRLVSDLSSLKSSILVMWSMWGIVCSGFPYSSASTGPQFLRLNLSSCD